MTSTIYYGGPILTMEPGGRPQALLEQDGRICGTGTLAELSARAPGAVLRDLHKAALLPAFLDPHSHITALAATMDLAQLGAAVSFEDITAALRSFQAEHRLVAGQWLMGFGYDHNVLKEHAHPTRQMLDEAFPDHPVLITHASGHMGVANTAALRAFGITADTPEPAGGHIGRQDDGRTPNGYLEESAFFGLASSMDQPSPEQQAQRLLKAEEVYFSNGIVLAQDGITGHDQYKQLSTPGLRIDTVGYADVRSASDLAGRPGIGGYKLFLDGSPQGRTAWMLEPYRGGDGTYCGYPSYPDETVTGYLTTALREGRQVLAHCNGDAAAAQYIRCLQRAQEATGQAARDVRPVIIHAQLVRREQLAQMRDLGIIPSFFAAHVWYWGDVHCENFGPERAATISPLRWAQALELPFTLHQDTPVIAPNMLESIWCAVCRQTRSGMTLGASQRISVESALRAVTIHAAYQYFMEAERGSLRAGKRADFVILDADPTAVEPEKIREISVLETIKDGQPVYRAATQPANP